MNTVGRLIAAAVCAAVMLFACPVSASAATAQSEYISGEFRYLPGGAANCVVKNYFYSDDYFAESGKQHNTHLRTMSLDLALTVFGSDNGHRQSENAEKLLSDIGFDTRSIYIADMNETPTQDTLGTVISHKKTAYGDVIAVAVRGSGYGLEWLSNLTSGASGNAEGFYSASQLLIDRIRSYENRNGLKGAKLWITGYSRAGCVAELAGKYINEHPDEFGITDDDLYLYTFEAPAGSSEYREYENIHNVVNPNDFVTMIYPETWGLYHVGVTERLECDDWPIYRKELRISISDGFSLENKKDYIYDEKTWQLKDIIIYDPVNLEDFLHEYVNWLGSHLDRVTYSQNSGYMCDIVSVSISRRLAGKSDLNEYLAEAFKDTFSKENLASILPLIYDTPGSPSYEAAMEKFTALINGRIASDDPADALTDAEFDKVRTALPQLMKVMISVARSDISGSHLFEKFGTFIGNSGMIVLQHTDLIVLPLVEAEDSYHNGSERVPEVTTTTVTTTPFTTQTPASTTTVRTTTEAVTTASTAAETSEPESIASVSEETTTEAETTTLPPVTTVTEAAEEEPVTADIPLWVTILAVWGTVSGVGVIAGAVIFAVRRIKNKK